MGIVATSVRDLDDGSVVVATTIDGYVSAANIDAMVSEWRSSGATDRWLVLGAGTTGYDPGAIQRARERFRELGARDGLRTIVAVLTNGIVVMGARSVSFWLAAASSPVRVKVETSLPAALRALRRSP